MGEFVFQMGGFIFKLRGHPMGGVGFDGGFSKVSMGGGHAPSPTMGNPAPSNSIFGRSYLKEESFNKVGRGCNCNSSIGVVPLWF